MDLLFSMIFGSGFAVIIAIAGIAIFLNFVPLGLWISAIAAGVNVGIFNLIGMRLRRVPASQIVLPLIKANKAGLDVNVNQLEAHYLAGGNVDVIGKGGAEIERLRLQVEKMIGKPVALSIVEVRTPDTNAQLVAENIAQQLEKRIGFRRAMKNSISRAMRMGVKGKIGRAHV